MWITYRGIRSKQNMTVKAFVYIMNGLRSLGVPTLHYLHTVMEGYETFHFSKKHLIDAYNRCTEVRHDEA